MVTVDAIGRVVVYGDSISAPDAFDWPRVAGGLSDQINAKFTQPPPSVSAAVATGMTATLAAGALPSIVRATAQTAKSLNYVAVTGVTATSGWTSGNLLAAMPAALAAYPPKVALLHIGINDVANGGSPTNPYQSNVNSILDLIHAADATTKIIIVGLMAHWEKWDSVTGWSPGPNVDDASLAIANTFLAGLPAARSYVTYVDVRALLLAGEQINNVSPVVGSTVGQQDGVYIFADTHGVHPNANLKLIMASQVMQIINVTP